MTLPELYLEIDGDYNLVLTVLPAEKLIDKHIRKMTKNAPRAAHHQRV